MISVSLAAVPNQSLTVQIADRIYDLSFRLTGAVMSASISRDGVPLVTNLRVTAGTPLLPYRYQEEGNFLLTTEAEQLPDYAQFEVTQFLVYVTAAELEAYRA
jgi:hypothetical protein